MLLLVAVVRTPVVEGRTTPLGATLYLCTVDIRKRKGNSTISACCAAREGMEVRTMHIGEPSSRVVRQSHRSSTSPYVHRNLRCGRTARVRHRKIEAAK